MNFGLPGGMGSNRFYHSCREQGMHISYADADELRSEWLRAFRENAGHMIAQKMPNRVSLQTARAFGFAVDGDTDTEESDGTPHDYQVTNILGMKRVKCTKNSALNFQFQSLAALGAKLAMWNIAMAGYLDRIVNFVHDEVVYNLYPEELRTVIPVIESCMIAGMRQVCPDVKVGVETECMLHWDKNATVYTDLEWSDDGKPLVDEPPYVKSLNANKKD